MLMTKSKMAIAVPLVGLHSIFFVAHCLLDLSKKSVSIGHRLPYVQKFGKIPASK